MDDVARLRDYAERCFRLAFGLSDPEFRDALEAMGRDFSQKADGLERETSGDDGSRARSAIPQS
jgi:hypothetical protein